MNTDCWPRIRDWRKQQRAALIARRTVLPPDRLRQWNVAIGELITSGFPLLAGMTIAFCWPFKSEFDARFVIRHFRERGATAALPAVVAKASPLQFRTWWPGAPMTPGVYSIPVPDGTELVVPDAAIVPMNGFDARGYRLGYRRRIVARHAADLVRDPDGLYAARPPALYARRRNRVRRGGQGRVTSLG